MLEILHMIVSHINQYIAVLNSVPLGTSGIFAEVSYFDIIVAFTILGLITTLFWKGSKT